MAVSSSSQKNEAGGLIGFFKSLFFKQKPLKVTPPAPSKPKISPRSGKKEDDSGAVLMQMFKGFIKYATYLIERIIGWATKRYLGSKFYRWGKTIISPWKTFKKFIQFKNWREIVEGGRVIPERRLFGKIIYVIDKYVYHAPRTFFKWLKSPFKTIFSKGLKVSEIKSGSKLWVSRTKGYKLWRFIINKPIVYTNYSRLYQFLRKLTFNSVRIEKIPRLLFPQRYTEFNEQLRAAKLARLRILKRMVTANSLGKARMAGNLAKIDARIGSLRVSLDQMRTATTVTEWVRKPWFDRVYRVARAVASGIRTVFSAPARAWDSIVSVVRSIKGGINAVKTAILGSSLGLKITGVFIKIRSLKLGMWFNRIFFVGNVGFMVFDVIGGSPLTVVLNPFYGVNLLQDPLSFFKIFTSPSFWAYVEVIGSKAVRGMLVRVASFAADKAGSLAVRLAARYGLGFSARLVAASGVVSSAISTAVGGISGAVVAVLSATLVLEAIFVGIIVLLVGGTTYLVLTGAGTLVTLGTNDIKVEKTLQINGSNIEGAITVTNTTANDIDLRSAQDRFWFIREPGFGETCQDVVEEEVTIPNYGAGFFHDPDCVSGCSDLRTFPYAQSLDSLGVSVPGGGSITWNFRLEDFKNEKGTYWNTISIIDIEYAVSSASVYLDVLGGSSCRSKFEAPCGWPVNFSGVSVSDITQFCNGSYTHINQQAIDIDKNVGIRTPIIATISGSVSRYFITSFPSNPDGGNANILFSYGIYSIVSSGIYTTLNGHMHPRALDFSYINSLPAQCQCGIVGAPNTLCLGISTISGCDMVSEGPFGGILVDGPTNVTKGSTVGEVGGTGYSSGPHLHYQVWQGNLSGTQICPHIPSGYSLVLETHPICTGAP